MPDWTQILDPQTHPVEILVRGSAMYLGPFVLLRVILKRESGTTGVTDLLVVVLIADAAQNGMAGQYQSITDGLLLVAVIIGWSFLLNWVAARWAWAERLIRPRPLPLVRDGRLLRHNMRRELVTEEELRGQLREQGIADLGQVHEARMEADGQFSVITTRAAKEIHRPKAPKSKQQV
ncbi:Uncharacterized membrane protein YcaP, DUF421 family [Amycolatopsis sacchari]|uniref:Uncharacterized membrane protein YcaP, DUF421 family n=1 Tax=Amycolatopsis sacchari TaxID=115433 RepID=A0A1I3K694_9PSEU|nr:YetF domain-containing protein [Amycolatopsis sacchari]SFI67944.1 Uncharacterized membrane protein YcaP, DUF421 family [Amycolatopsis sacchari]